MSITIEVDVLAGSDIFTTAREMQSVSDKLGITVTAKFNGVKLMFKHGDDPNKMAENYRKELSSSSPYKIATGGN